jgi:hypothetical protein
MRSMVRIREDAAMGRAVLRIRRARDGRSLDGPWEVRFRLSPRNAGVEIPPMLWSQVEIDGDHVVLLTSAPVSLMHALCGSALDHGADLPDIELARRSPGSAS